MTHGQYKWYVFQVFGLVRKRGNVSAVPTSFCLFFFPFLLVFFFFCNSACVFFVLRLITLASPSFPFPSFSSHSLPFVAIIVIVVTVPYILIVSLFSFYTSFCVTLSLSAHFFHGFWINASHDNITTHKRTLHTLASARLESYSSRTRVQCISVHIYIWFLSLLFATHLQRAASHAIHAVMESKLMVSFLFPMMMIFHFFFSFFFIFLSCKSWQYIKLWMRRAKRKNRRKKSYRKYTW